MYGITPQFIRDRPRLRQSLSKRARDYFAGVAGGTAGLAVLEAAGFVVLLCFLCFLTLFVGAALVDAAP